MPPLFDLVKNTTSIIEQKLKTIYILGGQKMMNIMDVGYVLGIVMLIGLGVGGTILCFKDLFKKDED